MRTTRGDRSTRRTGANSSSNAVALGVVGTREPAPDAVEGYREAFNSARVAAQFEFTPEAWEEMVDYVNGVTLYSNWTLLATSTDRVDLGTAIAQDLTRTEAHPPAGWQRLMEALIGAARRDIEAELTNG